MLTATASYLADSPTPTPTPPFDIAAGSATNFFFYAVLAASLTAAFLGPVLVRGEHDRAQRRHVHGLSVEATMTLAAAALAVRLVAWLCGIGYQPFALGQIAWVMLGAGGVLTLINIRGWLLTSADTNGNSAYDQPHSAR
jgi:hypothetical protein